MQSIYSKRLFYLLLFIVLFKILIAGLIELGNDEVYYYTYALQPDWNHFDHPPMVGVLIRFTTLNLYWLNEVSMRLGAILGCAVSSWFIFLTGRSIGSERTGWYAALIYNCSVYTGIIAGLFILPDSPQMPLWTASLYLMSRIVFKEEDKKTVLWLLLGLMIGLASLSKVHGLYLWAGFGLFILMKRTKWLLNWRLYAGVIITAVCIIPIVYWNIQNNFITYKFHSERVTHHNIQWDSLMREILGEFAYQNPVVFILLIGSLIYLIRNKKIVSSLANIWLLCMSIPMILLFWGVALFNPTLPHWSGPAYIPLFIIAAGYLESGTQKAYPSFIKIAGGFVISLLIFATAFVRLAPFNIGSQKAENFGEYCPTLDLSGWNNFSDAFAKLEKEDVTNGSMKPNSPIIINKWFPGGHLEFYTARKAGLPVIGIGNLEDLHKFAWLNKSGEQLHLGDDAYCIVASNMPADPTTLYKDYFTTIEPPVLINQMRSKAVVRFFYVYRLKQCKKIPDPILP
jgi:4-amino-4-deoxy-L-arabinose transferase-like glycosyltransferase